MFNGEGNWQGYCVPFLCSTNGENIYFLDVRNQQNSSRKIINFHTPAALTKLFEDNQTASYNLLKNPQIQLIKRTSSV